MRSPAFLPLLINKEGWLRRVFCGADGEVTSSPTLRADLWRVGFMPAGLEDVVAGESGICFIDGEKGILAYRGYNIHELATNSTFEETCHLLWFGRLPKKNELAETSRSLAN